MHRIDHATAVANMHGAGKPGFGGGDPTTGTPATRFTPEWTNDVQENIARVIEAADIDLVKGNGGQLHEAIAALIAANPSLGAGDGLEVLGELLRVKLDGATLVRSAAGLKLNLGNANIWAAQQAGVKSTLADAPAIAWNVATAQLAEVTIAGSRTLGAPSNLVQGGHYILDVIQGAGGSHALAYNAVYRGAAGITLSTAAGACDRLCWYCYDGTNLALVAWRKHVRA